MLRLLFSINIQAPGETLWNSMLGDDRELQA